MTEAASPRRVLVTRPGAGADTDDTAQLLRAAGFEPVPCPLLRIVPRTVAPAPPRSVAAVALTSANAVPALRPGLTTAGLAVPVFAVGHATARAARAAGCGNVRSADGNAADLASLILASVRGTVLLLAGEGQGAALAAALRAGGLRVVRRTAYAARPEPALSPAACALLAAKDVHGVVFMSAATARQWARVLPPALRPALPGVVASCISDAAASPVRHLPWKHLRVSLRPNLRDTLALL